MREPADTKLELADGLIVFLIAATPPNSRSIEHFGHVDIKRIPTAVTVPKFQAVGTTSSCRRPTDSPKLRFTIAKLGER